MYVYRRDKLIMPKYPLRFFYNFAFFLKRDCYINSPFFDNFWGFLLFTLFLRKGKSRFFSRWDAIELIGGGGSDNVLVWNLCSFLWIIRAAARCRGDMGGCWYGRCLIEFWNYYYTFWVWRGILFKYGYILIRNARLFFLIITFAIMFVFFFDFFYKFFFDYRVVCLLFNIRILIIMLRIFDIIPICLLIFYKVSFDWQVFSRIE